MGDNYMNFFPADPSLPKPDWPKLRALLLQQGFIQLPRQASGIVCKVGGLWHDIGHDRQLPNYHSRQVADIAQLVVALKDTAVIPQDFRLESGATVAELAATLRQGGFVSPSFAPSFEEEFVAGPGVQPFLRRSRRRSTLLHHLRGSWQSDRRLSRAGKPVRAAGHSRY